MTNPNRFQEVKEHQLQTLSQYIPIVTRVHGGHHPEMYEVQRLFNAIYDKTLKAGSDIPDLTDELAKLREITNHYTVPNDVCESYEAVYRLLSEVDQAYYSE